MGTKNHGDYQDFDDDDDNFRRRNKKHPRHATNIRGKGMKVLNSYVEEEDIYEDEHDQDYTTKFNIKY